MAIAHIPNSKVEGLLGELESLPKLHVTLIPQGVMALQPPPEEAPQQVTSVELRSPIEIFLAGLQSVGSWKGFLGYAAIAPFAGPAMNLAIATARGDSYTKLNGVIGR